MSETLPSTTVTTASESTSYRLAKQLLQWISDGASCLLGIGISVVIGFSSPVSSPPLALALQNPWIAGSLVLVLVVSVSTIMCFLTRELGTKELFSQKSLKRVLLFVAHAIIVAFIAAVLSVGLGLASISSSAPILVLLKTHPPLGITLIAILLAVIILSPLLPADDDSRAASSRQEMSRLMSATAISIVSALLLLSLGSVILIQPSWCPTTVCPIYFDPHGVHDDNLEAVFSAVQSSAFAISGDPTRYTVETAPQTMPAVRIDEPFAPYRVVIKVNNRQRGGTYPIIIEQVAVVIDQIEPLSNSLNVWIRGSQLDYHVEPYRATINRAAPGTVFPAVYAPLPGSHVQLQPGGADELDIQVLSTQTGVVQFHIQVTYRIANEAVEHTLTLPNRFQAAFGNGSNWRAFTIDDAGRLTPSP